MAESQQLPRYRITGKHIFRATTQDITMGTRPDGSPNVVRQPGTMERLEVGTILEDVTPQELAAMGDRLELVTEEEAQASQQAVREEGQLPSTFAPERGVHEPTGGPNTLIQKPPPTGEEVAALKAGQAAVRKLEGEQAQQRATLDKDLDEARTKAMTEGAAQALQQQEARGRSGSPPPAGRTPPARQTPASPPASSESSTR